MKVLWSGFESAESEAADSTKAELRGTETILLVEDERMIRDLLAAALANFGYRVLAAEDGEAAIGMAGKYGAPIHLILSDVVMPRMSGVELATSVRRWYPGVQVLLMSGFPEGSAAVYSLSDEPVFFIRKPFTIRALAAAVRSALDSRLPPDPSTSPAG